MNNKPIVISNITKKYNNQTVLDNISCSLEQGETFGLIGLNGAGKTTLIKIILQLTKADSGSVTLFGRSADDVRSRYNISYLPEKFYPSKHLKGIEYLQFALSYYGQTLCENDAEQVAQELDLNPNTLYNKISSYSKGMGQKLGLVGAFLINRPLLILDEPMSGLDPVARIKLKQKLQTYKQAGNSIFFSSHILSDIDEICDRIGIIANNKLIYIGTAQKFKQQHIEQSLEESFLQVVS